MKQLYLSSKVDPFIETESKNRFSLLKYVSLVEGDLMKYENITQGLGSIICCSSNWFNS